MYGMTFVVSPVKEGDMRSPSRLSLSSITFDIGKNDPGVVT
jgi:hypothetical protein